MCAKTETPFKKTDKHGTALGWPRLIQVAANIETWEKIRDFQFKTDRLMNGGRLIQGHYIQVPLHNCFEEVLVCFTQYELCI